MTRQFDVPQYVRDNQQTRANASPYRPCGEGIGGGRTCDTYPAVLFPRGWRCADHTPVSITKTPGWTPRTGKATS